MRRPGWRAPGPGGRRPGLVLGRRGRRPRRRLAAAADDDPRPGGWSGPGPLVDRRRVQPCGCGDGTVGRRPPRRRGAGLGGRGRGGPDVHLGRARSRGPPGRPRLAAAGVGEGTRVGILLPMLAETAIAVLALGRLRAVFTPIFSGFAAPGDRRPAGGVRGDPPDHRRRLPPPWRDRPAQGGRRRGGRAGAERPDGRRRPAARPGGARHGGPARPGRRLGARAGADRGRRRRRPRRRPSTRSRRPTPRRRTW